MFHLFPAFQAKQYFPQSFHSPIGQPCEELRLAVRMLAAGSCSRACIHQPAAKAGGAINA